MITRNSETPLFHQVADEIRTDIRTGKYKPGSMIPSEGELSNKYQVGRITIRHATKILTEEKLIIKKQGLGTFVKKSVIHQELSDLKTITEILQSKGIKPKIEVLSFKITSPPDYVCEPLKVRDGEELLEIKRLYTMDESPLCMVTIYLPREFETIAKPLSRSRPATETTFTVFERAGIFPEQAKHIITAGEAGQSTAKYLKIPTGTPILCSQRITYDRQGKPLESILFEYRSDKFDFTVKVARGKEGSVGDLAFWWDNIASEDEK